MIDPRPAAVNPAVLGPPDTDDDLEARHILARVRQRLADIDEPARIGPYDVLQRLGPARRGVCTYLASDTRGHTVYLTVLRIEDPQRRALVLDQARHLALAHAPVLEGDHLCLATETRPTLGEWLARAAAAR